MKKKEEENISVQSLILFNKTYFYILMKIFRFPLGRQNLLTIFKLSAITLHTLVRMLIAVT